MNGVKKSRNIGNTYNCDIRYITSFHAGTYWEELGI